MLKNTYTIKDTLTIDGYYIFPELENAVKKIQYEADHPSEIEFSTKIVPEYNYVDFGELISVYQPNGSLVCQAKSWDSFVTILDNDYLKEIGNCEVEYESYMTFWA